MKPSRLISRATWCAVLLGAACWGVIRLLPAAQAQDPPESESTPAAAPLQSSVPSEALKRRQKHVQTLLRRGDYEEALQEIDAILNEAPGDPWAKLYRSLVSKRLETGRQAMGRLTPEQLRAMQQRLYDEQRAQKRSAAVNKAVERQLRTEREKWDKELAAQARQTEREQKAQRRQAEREAAERAKQERARQRVEAEPAAARAEPGPPAEPEPPAGIEPPVTPETARDAVDEAEEAAIRAAERLPDRGPPLIPEPPHEEPAEPQADADDEQADTEPAGEEAAEPVSPSLAKRQANLPGAVQINARQMSVSPDQKVARAEGDVEVIFENTVLTCDRLTLFTDTKDAYAEGQVRIEQGSQLFRGEMAHYNLETKKGRFLQGTVSAAPWHEHGRSVEHIAEGVYEVTPGYVTTCEHEPPHFRLLGRRAIIFQQDRLARISNATLFVDQFPLIYLPYVSLADRQSPFFIIPGKKKPWEEFALMGYRYELPGPMNQKGVVKWDWRRAFGWGTGLDHQFASDRLGKGLLKVYYNEEPNRRQKPVDRPKGARVNRYRLLWRHRWEPQDNTSVVTDIQEYSDVNFRKELLFRDEFVNDDIAESFISAVRSDDGFSQTAVIRKRMNRFQSVTEAFPQYTLDVRQQPIGDTNLYTQTSFDIANLQTKTAHSALDTDAVRVDWFQRLNYALRLFRPVEVTPNVGVRQTYHTKDIQGADRGHANRDVISGQFSTGADASLKLFRIFPVTTNWWGLNINLLRHVLTPTITYGYTHEPTVANAILSFPSAGGPGSAMTFGVENKLQTKRPAGATKQGKPVMRAVDLARLLVSVPYTFQGSGNKQGGRIGDWGVDLELYPWPWMRLETDTTIPSHFIAGTRDDRIQRWNVDMVVVGGQGKLNAQTAHGLQAPRDVQAPEIRPFQAGPQGVLTGLLLPERQWYLGLGHRYSQNDKTEEVLQFDWRPTQKWEIGTFHRLTLKEVAGSSKRLNHLREYQYILRRDLHDWTAELMYRVDRELGEELFLTITLKAYPDLPIQFETGYHQPKVGSQSSPFSPVAR